MVNLKFWLKADILHFKSKLKLIFDFLNSQCITWQIMDLGNKPSTNTKSRACGANATLLTEDREGGSLKNSDRLAAEMFTKALDS